MSFDKVPGGVRKFHDGHSIPLVGLGTYKITGKQIRTAVNAALDAGYRMFDTAKYYKNEAEIGEAIEELLPKYILTRKDVFITTKMFPPAKDVEAEVKRLVDESLVNLRTTYIDLYLIHYPKPDDNENDDPNNAAIRKETYLALEKEKEAGRIRSVGVSNYESYHIDEIKSYGKPMPVANQVEYHPHFTRGQLKKY
ncbi:hypothetical protein WR25_12421 isoform D [Diploscapter pachys]|uniref:NADP-dependent oxidoreductase domain-containing protein n=1 Tax=Diploscapter pachys TaxID=2018661 RepID=A0A2A2J4G1_9BILA|nr:hypothetical protein WR25_12421 isoform A [Diploscapter pachys]PAV56664.1 hypothetical protein WR25_12421 isoform B [Diploscapter pachys]PAV56666.1 hypothetical protein WR25_12421 isoform D [Diploscapter pachys]